MRALAAVVGLFFIATGAFKLVTGPAAFAELLVAAGVPLASLNAWLVCAVEIGCGAALVASALRNMPRARILAAGVLAIDMSVAIATVGIRVQRGDPIVVRGVVVAGEPWRLGLELLMLALVVTIGVTQLLRLRNGPAR